MQPFSSCVDTRTNQCNVRCYCNARPHTATTAAGVVALEQKYNPAPQLAAAARKYSLDPAMLSHLEARHSELRKEAGKEGSGGKLSLEAWTRLVSTVFHADVADRWFRIFTRGQGGSLGWTVVDYIHCVCAAVRGSRDEHVTLLFSLFDEDADGMLR
jgi:hypothetical protein